MGQFDRNRDSEGRFTSGSRRGQRWREDHDYERENYGRGMEPPRDDRGRFMSEGENGDYYGGGRYGGDRDRNGEYGEREDEGSHRDPPEPGGLSTM